MAHFDIFQKFNQAASDIPIYNILQNFSLNSKQSGCLHDKIDMPFLKLSNTTWTFFRAILAETPAILLRPLLYFCLSHYFHFCSSLFIRPSISFHANPLIFIYCVTCNNYHEFYIRRIWQTPFSDRFSLYLCSTRKRKAHCGHFNNIPLIIPCKLFCCMHPE